MTTQEIQIIETLFRKVVREELQLQPKVFNTKAEVAKHLDVSVGKVYRMIEKGQITVTKQNQYIIN